jgi:hypothetical protein
MFGWLHSSHAFALLHCSYAATEPALLFVVIVLCTFTISQPFCDVERQIDLILFVGVATGATQDTGTAQETGIGGPGSPQQSPGEDRKVVTLGEGKVGNSEHTHQPWLWPLVATVSAGAPVPCETSQFHGFSAPHLCIKVFFSGASASVLLYW